MQGARGRSCGACEGILAREGVSLRGRGRECPSPRGAGGRLKDRVPRGAEAEGASQPGGKGGSGVPGGTEAERASQPWGASQGDSQVLRQVGTTGPEGRR